MSLIRPIQPSFTSGEVSPSIYSRIDIDQYHSGLRRCRNFIVHPHGGVSNRPGTRFVAETKDSTKESIVQEFIFSASQKYVLEIGHEYIRFYTEGARIDADTPISWSVSTAYEEGEYVTYSSSTATSTYYSIQDGTGQYPTESSSAYWTEQTCYEIPTTYQEEDLQDLRFETSADVIYITHKDYQPATLSRLGAANWVLEDYEPDDGPFMPENLEETFSLSSSALTGSVSLASTTAIFASTHVGALFRLTHYIESQKVAAALASVTTTSSIKCFSTWRIITHGTWTGKISIQKSNDGGTTWNELRSFSSTNDFNANTYGSEDVEGNPYPFLVRVNMYSYSSGTCNVDLTTDAFYHDGVARVTAVHSVISATATVIKGFGATTATTSWAEGSWSDYQGYPRVSRFFQDRLCFASTPGEPQTLWFTQTGNYQSFFRHSTLLDTDGITVTLPSRQVNEINGLVALTTLIVLTTASEWSVGPGGSGVLTPSSVLVKIQGYRGSYGINPVVVGNEALFVQANGKVVRNIGYDFASDTFTGQELNVYSKHLFDKWTIIDACYQQDPDTIIWFLRSDGRLVGATFMKEQQVIGWHWSDTGAD